MTKRIWLNAPPEGYRWWLFAGSRGRGRMQLHLSAMAGERTLCGKSIGAYPWMEPEYTQRTKCRACWLARAEAAR